MTTLVESRSRWHRRVEPEVETFQPSLTLSGGYRPQVEGPFDRGGKIAKETASIHKTRERGEQIQAPNCK